MKHLTILLCSCLSLSACASRLPLPASLAKGPNQCRLPVVKLTTNEFDDPDEDASKDHHYEPAANLVDALKSTTGDKQPKNVLVLSGGSLHGAFGAGLLYGWMHSDAPGDEKIPIYDFVTGVSTGALQSTFVFLDTSPDGYIRQAAQRDADRLKQISYLAKRFGGPTEGIAAPGTSYLANLAQFYMPDRESDLLDLRWLQRLSPNKLGMLELIRHHSVATMAPLRRVITAQIGNETLKAVADEARGGRQRERRPRKLYVAIADLTNRYGYAADLTRLAEFAAYPDEYDEKQVQRVFPGYQKGSGQDLLEAARTCYTSALIASSSVPPGVATVSIGIVREGKDGNISSPDHVAGAPRPEIASDRSTADHAFVDGGAAFAVFFSQLREQANSLGDVNMDLIVNGSYFPKLWDTWKKQDPRLSHFGKVKLNAFDILLQSADVLQTQVRLFSVQEARRSVSGQGRFRWALIDNRRIVARPEKFDAYYPWRGKYTSDPLNWAYPDANKPDRNCNTWHQADEKQYNPMEFFPRYMRCVVSYGLTRGRNPARRWNLCAAPDPARCEPLPEAARQAAIH